MIAGGSIEVFCHPTEDPEKVMKAVSFFYDAPEWQKQKAISHFNSPILIISAPIPKGKAGKFLQGIGEALSQEDKALLKKTFDSRLGPGGSLFLRFDKQKAYLGDVSLSRGSDVIKIEIKTINYPKDLEKSKRELWEVLF